MDSTRMKIAYVISGRNGKNFWNRVGVAFVNKDGSINVKLEAIPVNGELQIRDYVPREEFAGTSLQAHTSNGNGHEDDESFAELA